MNVIGNPVDILISPEADAAERLCAIAALGLDRPLWQQYLAFPGGAARGGLGRSFVFRGEIPSPLNPPAGCRFHPRCPHALARCGAEAPTLREVAPGHGGARHLNDAWNRRASTGRRARRPVRRGGRHRQGRPRLLQPPRT